VTGCDELMRCDGCISSWDIWIGLLYFFNFVLTPSMRRLEPRACEGVSGADVAGDGVVPVVAL